jgi:2-keto-4-pentenoate hydratase
MYYNQSGIKNLIYLSSLVVFCIGLFGGCQTENSDSTTDNYKEIVNEILQAQSTLTTISSISKSFGPLTVEEAYLVQDRLAAKLAEKYGSLAGYKIGFADSSALEKNNLQVPAYGPLFRNQVLENGGTVPLKDFKVFSIENEITFKIGRDIDKRCNTIDELKSHVESVHLGFDMSEDVFIGPTTVQDFIVCGAGSKYFMIGDGLKPDQVSVDDMMITVEFKDQVVYIGSSKNVLGNPWNVMLAVSNDLYERGKPLKKGDLIFSGKTAPAYKVAIAEAVGIFKGEGKPFNHISCTTKQ